MITQELHFGNATVYIDDDCLAETEEENQQRWKEIEKIVNDIFSRQ